MGNCWLDHTLSPVFKLYNQDFIFLVITKIKVHYLETFGVGLNLKTFHKEGMLLAG